MQNKKKGDLKHVSWRTSGTKAGAFTTVSNSAEQSQNSAEQSQTRKRCILRNCTNIMPKKISQFDVAPLCLIPFWLVTRACQRY